MKIGIFTNAYKPIISGVVNSIDLIRKGLMKSGHKVYIFAPRFPGYKDKEAGVFRFASVNLSSRVQFPLAIPYSIKLFSIINRIDFDIIHTHHPFLLGVLGAKISKKMGIPLVFTFHTQYEQYSHYIPFHQGIVKRVTREMVVNYTKKCDKIICPSPTISSLLKEYGITTPVEFIPNAIDLEQFKGRNPENVRQKYGLTKDEKILLYVGRIGIEKNLEFMLKAFKNISETENVRLMIVGEGAELENYKKMATEMGLDKKVIFTGRVEYKDIPDYYALGYAFLMTSTTEVKPLALLEAMASGLPIVAVSAAGSSDTITHGFDGLLTPLDIQKYTSFLQELVQNENLREKLHKGALETSQKYSIKSITKRLEKLYSSLIRKKIKEKAV